MCYDISFSTTIEMVTDYIPDLLVDPQLGIHYNMAAHVQIREDRDYPVIIMQEGKKLLTPLQWGIDLGGGLVVYNAQAEKVLKKGSAWNRRKNSRCLIPVTGIYEHREIKGWKKKVPYHVRLKDKTLFCLPGLYSASQKAYVVITRPANEVMSQIHNSGDNPFRMPLFLPDKKLELRWLEPELSDSEMEAILDYELPSEELDYYTVDTIRTRKERADRMPKNHPHAWPDIPPLGKDSNELSLF